MDTSEPSPSTLAFARPTGLRHGFTLIELLVVLAVLALLFATAAPVALGVMRTSRLATTGEAVMGRLQEARQMAIAEDTDVEVRIYEGTDPVMQNGAPQLCALQIFALRMTGKAGATDSTGEGSFQPAATLLRLDSSVVISSAAELSSIIRLKYTGESADDSAGVGLLRHVAFRFHSDGSTDLTPGTAWFFTLVGQTSGAVSVPPPNYYAVKIDSATGRLRTFRP